MSILFTGAAGRTFLRGGLARVRQVRYQYRAGAREKFFFF